MERSLSLMLTKGLLAVATLLMGGMSTDMDFPEVSKLPSQAGLPDPLVMFSGQRVATKDQWINERRPELKALFQHYMYGRMPPAPQAITSNVEREDRGLFDGKATKKEVTIAFGPPECPKIHLLLVVPNARKGPAPVFLGMNFSGNHALLKDPTIALPEAKGQIATKVGRGSQIDVWAIEQTIDLGYAVATFYNGNVDPDRPDVRGVQPHFSGKAYDWATIAAWAWGIQRAVDYLVTDSGVDKKRIAVVGHSRLGKAALLAAAFDERIALAIPHQAGCGGSAPSRGKVGESVKQINDRFPHWFNGRFKEFNGCPDRLPFDQHCLVALVAPRPVLFTNAVDDTWANPEGQFEVLQAADPVYRFLGVDGLDAKRMPETGVLVSSRLGYQIRPGQHSMNPDDWKTFIAFADKHLIKGSD
jgi:hypothetical protein